MILGYSEASPLTVNVNKFKVETDLDLNWQKLSNGNYVTIDRGEEADIYETTIETYGKETYINDIIDLLETGKEGVNTFTMTTFASDEKIFGENIDYSGTLSASFTKIGLRNSKSFGGFGLTVSFRLLSPAFDATAELPDFSAGCVKFKYTGSSEYDTNFYQSYFGDHYYYNHSSDTGLFRGLFTLTNSELANLREYVRVGRGTVFTLTDLNGVDYPFGSQYEYPHSAQLINIKEVEKFGIANWIIELSMAKDI